MKISRPVDTRVRAPGATRIELAAVFVGLAALVAIQLVASRSWTLLTQAPWLDECLTLLVVNDKSFLHGLAAIRGGVENTPPAFFLFVWPIAKLLGGITPLALRVLDCLVILLGCAAVYGSCRLFVERERALLGALVVATHPAVVAQMFQDRFYGFWMAVTALLVYATLLHATKPDRTSLFYARCGLAAVLVATHWFAVIGLGLITAGDLWAQRTARQRVQAALPMMIGILTLGLCLPLLVAQRAGLTVPTWIEPVTMRDVAVQTRGIIGIVPMTLLAAYGVWRLIARISPASEGARWTDMAPGLALLLFPAVLIVLSIVLQPVLLSRYLIPTVISVGMLAALVSLPATVRGGRLLASVACAALVVIGAMEMRQLRRVTAPDVAAIESAVTATDSLRAAGAPVPILFLRRFEHYPVLQLRPGDTSATALLDFEKNVAGLSNKWVFERDMARRVSRMYPRYKQVSVDDAGRLQQFLVIARSQDEIALRRLFPRHEIWPRSRGVYAAILR